MKKTLFSAIMLSATTSMFGQNSLVSKAQFLFDGNELQKAADMLAPALTSGKTKDLAHAFNLAGNIESRFMNQEIMKAAKNEPCDTALFISSLNKAVDYFIKSNEYDVAPDEKGRVKPKYQENNKSMLGQMLSYYGYAGQFQNANKDMKGAYKSFERYLELPKCSVFSKAETDSIYKKNAGDYQKIAYYAAMLAYREKEWKNVLKNVDMALQDTAFANDGYTMKLSALLHTGDTAKWVDASKEAIKAVHSNVIYSQNLLYYYSSRDLKKEAAETADEIVANAGDNKMAWYARGCIFLNVMDNHKIAREAFEKALAIDPNFVEANHNIGVSYVNEIVSMRDKLTLDPKKPQYKKDRETVLEFYRKALPYFEKARQLAPTQSELWALPLKNVYYNLEMKDKEKEMDRYIENK